MTALACALLLALAPQDSQPSWLPEQKDVAIPLRDKKSLAADVYLPPKEGRYPAIVIQTPYGKQRIGAVLPENGDAAQAPLDRASYAVVVVDWRGFHGSKDARKPGPRTLGEDGHDVVEWVAAQPWCDGKVGTWGGSALGQAQFATAIEQPEHLVCCVPMITPLGQDHDRYYTGGVLREAHVRTLDALGFGLGQLVRASPLSGAPAWKLAKAASFRPERVQVPMLLITGWWDLEPGAVVETFEALRERAAAGAREHMRLLVGPWDHMTVDRRKVGDLEFPAAQGAAAAATRKFFDFWLRGEKTNGWEQQPAFRWYRPGDHSWVSAERWPGPDVEPQDWHLCGDGGIAREAGGGERVLRHDPQNPVPTLGGQNLPPLPRGPTAQNALDARGDVLVYTSKPLERPLRIADAMHANVTLTCDRPDCDVAVRVCDLQPDGKAILLADGIQRAKLRVSTSKPSPLKPGEEATLVVELPPIPATLHAGHRLRVYLSASNAPRFEVNACTGDDHFDAKRAKPAVITVKRASLVIPVPK